MSLDHLALLVCNPVWQSTILAFIGALLFLIRRVWLGLFFVAVAASWLWICATPAFASLLQRSLIAACPTRLPSDYPQEDVIVVLGGGRIPSGDLERSLDRGDSESTRVGFGLRLFDQHRAPLILLSGGEGEAKRMAMKLQQQGVSPTALLTETRSLTTHQNAVYSARILQARNLRRILLVTSPIHMPRAAASFRREDITVIPAPTSEAAETHTGSAWWVPKKPALRLSLRCLWEYLGLWAYRLRGWA